jgi:Na+-transporting methylmalonyl-CoA/oxaloacetate decarboxylase gamma subunit
MEIILMILTILVTLITTISFFAIRNLLKKNEAMEDFINKQSEAIAACDNRLKNVDQKGVFYADDEIGWFFKEVKKIQEALNEFRLK